jgi:hypothetical protein
MNVQLIFTTPGYIAHPYTVEMYKLIELQKRSGMMRARSDKKRREALEKALKDAGMSFSDYEELKRLAERPFATDAGGEIIIAGARILDCLVNASDVAPSAAKMDNIRSRLKATDFRTGKSKPDGVWERFAVVRSATGKLSNQRGLRSNQYIENFTAEGEITFDPAMVQPKALRQLLEFAGREVGIGASRKMGWGRFTVKID